MRLLYQTEDTTPYECDGLTAYRQRPLAGGPARDRGAGGRRAAGLPCAWACRWWRAARAPACRAAPCPTRMGVTLVAGQVQQDPQDRHAQPHGRGAVRRAQPGHQRGGRAATACTTRPTQSSQIACTIGGNVAENSGGVHCLKYGLTLHNVLQVRGFTVEGEPIEFGGEALDAPGYDLLALVVGSEGMLAVTTEVTVKLVPKPQLARCIMASFDDLRKAGDAVAAVIAAGIIPAGLEMMDKPMTAAVEDFVHAGYDLSAEAILLCESDGTPEEVEEEIGRMSEVLRAAAPRGIAVSQRRGRAPAVLERAQERLPRQSAASARTTCAWTAPSRASAWPTSCWRSPRWRRSTGLRCANVFHAGDGNLHPLILFDANDPDQLHRCELFGADILETSVAMGGTVTGEHGVGVEKLNSMCVQFSARKREQMFAVKRAFDRQEPAQPRQGDPHAAALRRVRQGTGARRQDQAPGPAPVLAAMQGLRGLAWLLALQAAG